jgi:DNA-binding response OmpR family regulator
VAAATEILSDRGDIPLETVNLKLDPLNQKHVLWKNQRISLTMTGMRVLHLLIQSQNQPVPYAKLFDAVLSGKTEDNVRKHISTIRSTFKEVDPTFESIKVVPQYGFMWTVK